MPANLPPEYFDAEKRFKQASTPAEKCPLQKIIIIDTYVARRCEVSSISPPSRGRGAIGNPLREIPWSKTFYPQ